jgi:glucose/arabinose dehydrogenase
MKVIRRNPFAVLVAMAAALGAIAISRDSSQAANSGAFKLVTVATADTPMAVIWDPTTKAPFVVQQRGKFSLLAGKPLTPVGVSLDVSAEIADGGEQGLLGAAFSKDGTLLFINLTNKKGDTEIREYKWNGGVADPASKRVLLTIEQPYANHNGGHVLVDATGLLWIGTGDGGSAGDPENRAQNLDSLLGKMLRIDPRPEGGKPYRIPPDNPYAKGGGRPEIWAYGLRNPWRYDIDATGKRLFIGDVGQDKFEEVNVISLAARAASAAPNFGWKLREGMHTYGEVVEQKVQLIDPITEYPHSDGCSVTGGVFYKGTGLPGLKGRYLYGDYCKGWIGTVGQRKPGAPWVSRRLGLTVENLSSFNTTPSGEVWVTSTKGTISALTGR